MSDATKTPETEDEAGGCTCPAVCAIHPDDEDEDAPAVTQADLAALDRARMETERELRAELAKVREARAAATAEAPAPEKKPQRGARAFVIVGIVLGALLALSVIARAIRAASERGQR